MSSSDASAPPRVLIVDTSPFIGLAKIGHEDLLTVYGCPVWMPETVAQEVEAGPEDDTARLALTRPWLRRVLDTATPPELAARRLDAGERAVLALGLAHPGALLVLDDGDAAPDDQFNYRAAQALSLTFTGTVGIAIQARQTGASRQWLRSCAPCGTLGFSYHASLRSSRCLPPTERLGPNPTEGCASAFQRPNSAR